MARVRSTSVSRRSPGGPLQEVVKYRSSLKFVALPHRFALFHTLFTASQSAFHLPAAVAHISWMKSPSVLRGAKKLQQFGARTTLFCAKEHLENDLHFSTSFGFYSGLANFPFRAVGGSRLKCSPISQSVGKTLFKDVTDDRARKSPRLTRGRNEMIHWEQMPTGYGRTG